MNPNTFARAGALAALLLGTGSCADDEALVARASGQDLTVDETAALLSGVDFPNQPDVVLTIADLWVDYMLLARAAAEDSTLAKLDVSHVVDQQVQQELILALREKLVHPDTVVSEAEIDRRAAEVTPGSRVHARHILLLAPPGSSQAQRDSVRAFAEALVVRIRRGESFEQLAREHSADRATAEDGGDLGWFGPGELVAELERAAFALRPGSVSDVVESAIGLHIIRVDEVEAQSNDEVRAQVRGYIQQMRVQAADSALIAEVEKNAAVHIEEGAAELARRAAENPGLRLSRRARERALVTYAGGKVTVGEIAEFMQSRANQFRIDILNAPDETLEQNLLAVIAQRELLVAKAREEGIEVTQARQDSLAEELRGRVLDVARGLELVQIRMRTGESAGDARERKVQEILAQMIGGGRDVVPLGSFSFVLREMYSGQVYPTGVEKVVARIAAERGPPLRPDTAGGATGGMTDTLPGALAPLPGGSP